VGAVRLLTLLLFCASFTGSGLLRAAADEGDTATARPAELTLRDAVVLGVVEGLTEFLPVSSTGHLIIANRFLGLDADEPLRDEAGQIVWFKAPSAQDPDGVPLTLKLAADTYIVVIQGGAIVAVVLLFWAQLMGILRGMVGRDAAGLRLLRNILLAFLPPAILGLSVHGWIDAHLFSVGTVVVALISGAVLMLAAERWRKRRDALVPSRKEPHELTVPQAVGVGCVQCLSLWPGMSRSMVTMVGGYFMGLTPPKAAEFSFLVGLPVLGGAAVYKFWQAGPAMVALFGWTEMIVGALVATICAALAVKFFIAYLSRRGLEPFAYYRIGVALVLAIWFL
jgi:undecaprenyl-diphosphatase